MNEPASLSIPLRHGGATSALHYAATQAAGRLLVLAHGAGAGQRHPFMVAVAHGLSVRGIDVITFNFPYMDSGRRVPDRTPALESCFRDVLTAVRTHPAASGRQVFLGGKSMGGRMATHLAAAGERGVAGVVVLGYPLHPPGKPEGLRTAHLPAIAVPILVVQGERDAFGSRDEIAAAFAGTPGPVTLHVVGGGDHSLAVRGSSRAAAQARFEDVLSRIAGWMSEPHSV